LATSSINGVIRFGVFEVDRNAHQLRKNGIRVRLPLQPYQLLTVLLERPGEVFTRDELRTRLWPSDVFVDFDHGLNKSVQKLRDALNDSAETPRYIETLLHTGYRFIAPVSESSLSLQDPVWEPVLQVINAPPAGSPAGATIRRGRAGWAVLAACIILALLAIVTLIQGRPHAPQIRSLAVLPLDNLSGDPAQEYFADGMTDELITMLAKNSTLGLVSRTSVMQYKGAHRPLRDIARELGVNGILEG
jgi:DNA-binding winged helix-turn-helix (wHTH) protein